MSGQIGNAINAYRRSVEVYRRHGPQGSAPMSAKASGLVADAALQALLHPIPYQCPQLPDLGCGEDRAASVDAVLWQPGSSHRPGDRAIWEGMEPLLAAAAEGTEPVAVVRQEPGLPHPPQCFRVARHHKGPVRLACDRDRAAAQQAPREPLTRAT